MPKRKEGTVTAISTPEPPRTSSKPAAKSGRRRDPFATFPIPREVIAEPELLEEYTRPGHLQFVHGNDKNFLTQSLDWASFWSDAQRPYYDDSERKTALPLTSWPPNFNLLAPEQQYQSVVEKPVHGGLTWPGHPKPELPSWDDLVDRLPEPIQRFFYS